MAPQVEALLLRLFDLHEVFTTFYCHPDFCGSTSIKKVLSVLVPELCYKDLEIGRGDTAVAMFVKMAKGRCSDTTVQLNIE